MTHPPAPGDAVRISDRSCSAYGLPATAKRITPSGVHVQVTGEAFQRCVRVADLVPTEPLNPLPGIGEQPWIRARPNTHPRRSN